MRWLLNHFLRGCLVLFPIVGSTYAVWLVLSSIDQVVASLVDLAVPADGMAVPPGLGLVGAVVVVTLVGAVASNVVGRAAVNLMEKVVDRVPLLGLLYGAIRDFVSAFVGERKRFDQPAVVRLGNARVLGFITRNAFADPRFDGCVAVYVPQSYNFAGNLVIVDRSEVEVLDMPGTDFLAFVVSGGIHTSDGTPLAAPALPGA